MRRFATSVLLVLMLAGGALAQGAGSGLERGGADVGRDQRGDRAPVMDILQVNALAIITLPSVRQELQLSEDQSGKIREILEKARPGADASPERR
ncbi:MAG: hypothetical protein C4341_05620, partial [Armatimonadota bacterium]